MNKLLRNPWVVATLVIGMAALWWVQMRSILHPGGLGGAEAVAQISTEAASSEVGDDSDDSQSLIIEPLSVSRTSAPNQLRWTSAPARDPFGPAISATPVPAPAPEVVEVPAAVAEVETVETVETLPALEAVLNTPSAHIAVVDGRIVRVGDKVNGRAVLRIDSASVALGAGREAGEPLLLKLPAR